ncbi:MAG: LamG-like jellyroll fold domain-containing protein [Planctomycetota bacterium]
MNFYNLITRARILASEFKSTFQDAMRTTRGDNSIDVTVFEQRVMFSATPLAPVVDPELASLAQEQTQNLEDFSESDAGSELATAAQTRNLVLIDTSVENYQLMVDSLSQDVSISDIQLIDSTRDGIEQVSEILSSYTELESLHLVTHGDDGRIRLGTTTLTQNSLSAYAGEIAKWETHFSESADFLIYGCDLASSEDGQLLVESLAELTATDVAASDDLTGHVELGGDWTLEYAVGDVSTDVPFSDRFQDAWFSTLDITSNLVAHYELEENGGSTTADSTVNNNDGTLTNSPAWDSDAAVGSYSLNFDGDASANNAFVNVADDPTLDFSGDFTVAFWYNSNTAQANNTRIVGSHDGNDGFTVHANADGSLNFFLQGSNDSATQTQTGGFINDDTWHHVVAVRSADSLRLYVDKYTSGVTATTFGTVDPSAPFTLGAASSTVSDFEGKLDDVRIYTRALTASDVDELYALGPVRTSYSTSNGADTSFEHITNVAFAGVSNSTGQEAGGYGDYTSQTATVVAGATNSLSVAISPDSNEYVTAWVDWNQDFDFNDAGEQFIVATNVSASGPHSVNLVAPNDAVVGVTRMRVSLSYNEAPTGFGTFDYGEVEDYSVMVVAASPQTFTVTNTNDTGVGSLRQAILDSNVNTGIDTIEFDISDPLIGGVHTINVGAGGLGLITDAVHIDATTDSDFAGNPVIEINGSSSGGADGLSFFGSGSDGSSVRGLIINGFDEGILVNESDNVTIVGNWIGLDSTGENAQANSGFGIEVLDSTGTTIGGSSTADRNVVTGNIESGISLWGSTVTGTTIQGNYIGLNASGTVAVGNSNDGISIGNNASNNLIGGDRTLGQGNVIVGNEDGIEIGGTGTNDNLIYGNFIGTDSTNATGQGNLRHGIVIYNGVQGTRIGGGGAEQGNIISGNSDAGIVIDGNGVTTTSENVIVNNLIGVASDGSAPLGNSDEGIHVFGSASNNLIGGSSGEGNIIANGTEGVVVEAGSTGISIVGNSIYGNSSIGIDLAASTIADGVSLNDTNDIDGGGNQRQNFPVITQAELSGSSLLLSGSLDTDGATTQYRIDFFGNAAGTQDPTHGEGQYYLGTTMVTTNGSGDAIFTNVLLNGVTLVDSDFVTATATRIDDSGQLGTSDVLAFGDTSEMAANFAITTSVSSPSNLEAISTTDGGLSLNEDGGNDAYLIANDGGAIFENMNALTAEVRFSMDSFPNSTNFFSYATSSDDNVFKLNIRDNGDLSIGVNSNYAYSSAIDYRLLADGEQHTLSVTWDSSGGLWEVFVDGIEIDNGSGLQSGALPLDGGGTLVLGNDQDSVDGGYDTTSEAAATLFDARIFNVVQSDIQIASSYRSTLLFDEPGLVANWTFNKLSSNGVVTESVNGNNLTVRHASGTGFVFSQPSLTLEVDENAVDGTVVGQLSGTDVEREAVIASLLANDTDLRYLAETGKFYKVVGGTQFWSDARTAAESTELNGINGQLVTIRSATENEFIRNFADTTIGYDVWIGGTDSTIEGEWRWIDGGSEADQFWQGDENGNNVSSAYSNFEAGQPNDVGNNEDVLRLENSTGTWYDADHDLHDYYGYMIEWDADTVIDASQALTYTIASQTVTGAFAVDADSGQISVADGNLLDFETNATHALTMRVTDVDGLFYDEAFSVSLNNLNDVSFVPTDLSSGIELNSDGGNDAYLVANNGGALFAGLSELSIEVNFESTRTDTSTLLTYATATTDKEISMLVHSSGQLRIWIADTTIQSSAIDYRSLSDGQLHSLALTWDNANGDWAIYVDGELTDSGTGISAGQTIDGGGALVFGQDQDSLLGGFSPAQRFEGTLYDVRTWNEVRSEAEIALNHQQKIDSSNLPVGLIANWQMDGFDGSNEVVDVVSGNNLGVGHATETGFTTSTPVGDLHVNENAVNGSLVGHVAATVSDMSHDIVSDGLFTEAPDPVSFTSFSSGQSLGDWTVTNGTVFLHNADGVYQDETPLGGNTISINAGDDSSISQNLSTEVGKQYQVVFAGSANWDSPDVRGLRVSAAGQSADVHYGEAPSNWNFSNSIVWEKGSLTFTATDTTTVLTLQDISSSALNGILVADVQVIEIPSAVTTILNNDSTLSYDAATGKFYRFVESPVDFTTALSSATGSTLNGVSGEMVTINSSYENELIRQHVLNSGTPIWLGINDLSLDGTWRQYDGANPDGTIIEVGDVTEPGQFVPTGSLLGTGASENLARILSNGSWNDLDASNPFNYVVQWDASEVLSSFTFDLTDDATGRFAIDANTGAITVANSSLLDFESATTHNVTVEVTDAAGNSFTEVMTIAIDDIAISTVSATGSGTAAAGGTYTINLSADEQATSWTINWGDGSIETIVGNPQSVTHTYALGNEGLTFNVMVSATDGFGTHFNNDLIATSAFLTGEGIYAFDAGGSFDQSFSGTELTNPYSSIVGPDGLLYVAGHSSDNIVRYNPVTGALVDTFVTSGSGGLNAATGMAFGTDGHLYVSNQIGDSILKFDGTTGAFISTFVAANSGGLNAPVSIAFQPDGHLYVASYNTNSILRYDASTGAFVDDFVASGSGGLSGPAAMAWGPDGNLYVSGNNNVIKRFDGATGTYLDNFVSSGSGGLGESLGLAFGPDGNLYVSSYTSDQILIFDGTSGALIGDYIAPGDGGLDGPTGITFLPSHQVTIDAGNTAPVLNNLDANPTYTEDGSPVVLDSDVQVFDAELSVSDNFANASLTVTRDSGANAEDIFSFVDGNGISLSGTNLQKNGQTIGTFTQTTPGQLLIVFTDGNGEVPTQSDVNAILQQIAYRNTSDTPPANVLLDWVFDDGNVGAQGNGGAMQANGNTTVNLVDVPDPANVVAPTSGTVDEDTPLIFSVANGNAITVSSGNSADPVLTVTLTVANGGLTLGSTTNISFLNGTSDGDSTLSIAGTEADLNAALDGLQYLGASNFNGSDTLTVSTGSAAPTETNLYARYEFLNGSLADESGNGYDGAAAGDPTFANDPQRGDVMAFDGNDTINVVNGTLGLGTSVTISAWVNLDAGQTDARFLSIGDQFYVTLDPAITSLGMGVTASGFTTNNLDPNNRIAGEGWNHVAATINDVTNELNLYLNGVLIRNRIYDFGNIDWSSNPDITIGGRGVAGAEFAGSMDDVRVYNAELSQSEIIATMGDQGYDRENISITVNPVNDAPVLDNTGFLTLDSISDNDVNNGGNTVAEILLSNGGDRITDVDVGAAEGIAIFATGSTYGTWQYNIGSGWTDVGTVAIDSALLLRSTDSLRFVPDGLHSEIGTVVFSAWDQTTGTTGTKVDTTIFGGTTAFSTATETAVISVTEASDAPAFSSNNTVANWVEDGGPVGLFSGTSIDSIEAGDLIQTLTIGVSGLADGTDEILMIDGQAIELTHLNSETTATSGYSVNVSVSGSDATVTITRTGGFSDAAAEALVDGLGYNNTSDTPQGTVRVVTLTSIQDDGGTSNGGSDLTNYGLATLVNIQPVNDAPVLDNSGSPALNTLNEDDIGNAGMTVADLLATGVGADPISDAEGDPEGIAVTSRNNGNGQWQYSIDGGGNWIAFGTVSESSALLLRSTDLIRFNPDGNNGITQTFDFRAWDQTSGSAGSKVDTTSNGGSTAFSTAVETAVVLVNDVNDAPVLDNSGPLNLTSQLESAGAPVGAVGTVITDLVALGGNVTDVDNSSQTGIAVTAADITNGTWWYTTDGGTNWNAMGAVSDSAARVLNASSNTRVYFQSNVGFNGTISDAITFRAWDRTLGASGSLQDTSSNGGSSAFSTVLETADITISPVNDAPVISGIESATLSYNENDGAIAITSTLSISDADDTDIESARVQISGNYANGEDVLAFTNQNGIVGSWNATTGELSLTGSATLAEYETALQSVTYSNGSEAPSTATRTVSFFVNDGDVNSNTLARDIGITPVNDSPGIGTNTGATVAEGGNVTITNTMLNEADVDDAGAGLTYTITVAPTNGQLELTTNLGVSITSFTQEDIDNNRVLFVHNGTQSTADSFGFSLADGGEDGAVPINGSFSLTVTNVNDAPVNTVPGAQSVNEDTPLAISGISVADDDNNLSTVRLSVINGTLSVTLNGAASISAGANGTNDLTLSGSLVDINATLASLTYQGNANFNGSDTLTVLSTDSSASTDSDTVGITVVAVNDAPVLTSAPGGGTYNEGAPGTYFDNSIALSDVDNSDFDGGRLTLSITNNGDPSGDDRLIVRAGNGISVSGTSINYDNGGGPVLIGTVTAGSGVGSIPLEITLNSAADQTAVQALAQQVAFYSVSEDPFDQQRTLSMSVSDGDGGTSNTATRVMNVIPINDDQTLTTNTGLTVLEGTTGNAIGNLALETTDLDDAPSDLVYQVTSTPIRGTLFRNGTALGVNDTFTQSDIDSGLITYDHDGSEFLSDSFGFIVDDGEGASTSATFNISITLVNDNSIGPVSDSDASTNLATENSAVGTTVGITAFAEDPDSGDSITYSLFDDDGGRFSIDNTTGIVRVAGAIDREVDGPTRSITVRATSTDGSSTDQTFTININDVDEFNVGAVADVDAAINAVNENAAIGTAVGITASATDDDATNDGIIYSLFDDDGGRFSIDNTTGIVRVAGAIDREVDGPTRSITVRATSVDGSTTDQTFTIGINDVNEFGIGAITDVNSATNQLVENAAPGTTVGITASAFDGDATNNSITYSLSDNDGGRFMIDSSTGTVSLAGSIDYEGDGAVRNIVVRADSLDGSSTTQAFTISIIDINEAPNLSFANSVSLDELIDTSGGLSLGFFTVNDVDIGDTISLAVVGGADATAFALSGNELLIDAGILDFETRNNYEVIVAGIDSGGLSEQWTVNVTINDVNESPQIALNNVVVAIDESADTATGIRVADIAIIDDALGNNQLSLAGTDATRFEIVGNELRIRAGQVLDFETQSQLDVIVVVDDLALTGQDDMETASVSVLDVNEQPVGTGEQYSIDQLSVLTIDPAELLVNDFDPESNSLTLSIVSPPTNGTLVVQADGTFVYSPVNDFVGFDQFAYQLSDGQLTGNPIVVELTVIPVAPPPSDPQSDPVEETNNQTEGPTEPGTNSESAGENEPSIDEPDNPTNESEPSEETQDNTKLAIPMLNPSQSADGMFALGEEALVDALVNTGETPELRSNSVIAVQQVSSRTGTRAVPSALGMTTTRFAYAANAISSTPLSTMPFVPLSETSPPLTELTFETVAVGTAAVTTASLSVGYVIWLIRGGTLLTSFVSVLPAWTSFDPLPIVNSANQEEDSESLVDIVNPGNPH